MKRINFLLLQIILSFSLCGQNQYTEERFKVAPLSPNAAALGTYGHTPVGHYTGIPKIDIPLYEIDLDGKKFPMSISYHAGGIRVASESSSIGLGWTLNLGGAITQMVNGEDDFVSVNNASPSFYKDQISHDDFYNKLHQATLTESQVYKNSIAPYNRYLSEGGKGEPDFHYYNFAGFSGKMIFDKNGSTFRGVANTQNLAKAILFNPDSYVEIIKNVSGGFTARDMEGYTYVFNHTETSFTFQSTLSGLMSYDEQYLKQQLSYQPAGFQTTTYYLSYIESPQKNRITFEYEDEYLITPISISEQFHVTSDASTMGIRRYDTDPYGNIIRLQREYKDVTCVYNRIKQLRPSKVIFNDGVIIINSTAREDLQPQPNMATPKRISSIEIKNATSQNLKTFVLQQSYRGQSPNPSLNYLHKRLMLDGITENGDKRHAFVYNTAELPAKNSLETDFFGFYNQGQREGTNPIFYTIPTTSAGGILMHGRDKMPKPQLLQNMMLNQITYPTGGTTNFFFEAHTINGIIFYLREITMTEMATIGVTGSEYNNPCNVMGTTTGIRYTEFELTEDVLTMSLTVGAENTLSSPVQCGGLTSFSANIEILEGDRYVALRDVHGRTVGQDFNVSHQNLGYRQTYPISNSFFPKGKYRIRLSHGAPGYTYFYAYARLEYLKSENISETIPAGAGLRVQKITNNTGTNSEIRRFNYSGTRLMYRPIFSRRQVVAPMHYIIAGPARYSTSLPDVGNLGDTPWSAYTLSSTTSLVPFSNAAQGNLVGYQEVTEFFGENGENGFSKYRFENLESIPVNGVPEGYIPFYPMKEHVMNGSPLTISHHDKNGFMTKLEEFEYVLNKVHEIPSFKVYVPRPLIPTDGSYTAFYNITVEEAKLKNKTTSIFASGLPTVIQRVDYEYNEKYGVPVNLKSTGSHSKNTNQLFKYAFDYTDDISLSMVNKNLLSTPIETINTVNDQVVSARKVAFSSYSGGILLPSKLYSFESTSVKPINSYQQFYQQTAEVKNYNQKGKPLEVVLRGDIKAVYLWGYGGQYPIAKIENATYAEVLGILGQAAITSLEALNVSESTINTHIQTLRNTLTKSQVTTYTYSPLTGMKSMTDPRGQTEYYEYDGFQRLKEVLDFERNVLTDYQYHYKP